VRSLIVPNVTIIFQLKKNQIEKSISVSSSSPTGMKLKAAAMRAARISKSA
jgi:hypothetical protein